MQKRAAAGGSRNRANILRTKRILVKQQFGSIPDTYEAIKKQQLHAYHNPEDAKFHEPISKVR